MSGFTLHLKIIGLMQRGEHKLVITSFFVKFGVRFPLRPSA